MEQSDGIQQNVSRVANICDGKWKIKQDIYVNIYNLALTLPLPAEFVCVFVRPLCLKPKEV